jgi:hypothetical protein
MKCKGDLTDGAGSVKPLEIQFKKNQLFVYNGSGIINFLMKPCNPAFLRNSKFNVESRFEIKMRPFYLKTQRWRRFPVFPEV